MIENLSEEQVSLDEASRRLVAERHKDIQWVDIAELGWLEQVFPEAAGGISGLKSDALLLARALGTGLVNLPFMSCPILCGHLIAHLGGDVQRKNLIPGIMAGSRLLALAHCERASGYDLHAVATSAQVAGDSFILNGRKTLVLGGDSADTLIVSARTAGDWRDRSGISLFLIDARLPGVEISGHVLIDGQRAADVSLHDVKASKEGLLGQPGMAIDGVEDAYDAAIVALLGDAVGTLERGLSATRDYLSTRSQFGVKLREFQTLRHRLVDMLIAREELWSLCLACASSSTWLDRNARRRAISAAKTYLNQSGVWAAEQAVQLHGALGVTEDCVVAQCLRRITVASRLFGDVDYHLNRLRVVP